MSKNSVIIFLLIVLMVSLSLPSVIIFGGSGYHLQSDKEQVAKNKGQAFS